MPPKKKKAKITEAQENQMVDILQKAYTDDTLAVQWATEDSRAKGTKRQAGTGIRIIRRRARKALEHDKKIEIA